MYIYICIDILVCACMRDLQAEMPSLVLVRENAQCIHTTITQTHTYRRPEAHSCSCVFLVYITNT